VSEFSEIESVGSTMLLELLSEVKLIFTSNHFLDGNSNFVLPEYYGSCRPIKCKLCSLEELLVALEFIFNNEIQTVLASLDENLQNIRGAYNTIHEFYPFEFKRSISVYRENITKVTDESPQLIRFCQKLSKYFSAEDKKDGLFWGIQSIVAQHINTIVQSRTLTLSKRDRLSEIILKIYDIGLFPFGWDFGEHNVFVFNPKDLQ
jgi:hypothetical protein